MNIKMFVFVKSLSPPSQRLKSSYFLFSLHACIGYFSELPGADMQLGP